MLIGVDVGGTNLKAGAVTEDGGLLSVSTRPFGRFTGAEDFALRLVQLARDAAEKAGASPGEIRGVGIGVPGAVEDGDILYTVNIPLSRLPLRALFQKYLAVPVALGNDADCAALGEWRCGAGRGCRDFAVITLGTGVGGGLILNGGLYTGGGMAGEVGHMVTHAGGIPCSCGRRGCWERYASATALADRARQEGRLRPDSRLSLLGEGVTAKDVFSAAQAGDDLARSLCGAYAREVAEGIVNLLNVLHLQRIALGGGVCAAPEELLIKPVRDLVHRTCYARRSRQIPEVVRAQLGNRAGIVGAALLGDAGRR